MHLARLPSTLARLLCWLGFDWTYRPSMLDARLSDRSVSEHGEPTLRVLEQLGYLEPTGMPGTDSKSG